MGKQSITVAYCDLANIPHKVDGNIWGKYRLMRHAGAAFENPAQLCEPYTVTRWKRDYDKEPRIDRMLEIAEDKRVMAWWDVEKVSHPDSVIIIDDLNNNLCSEPVNYFSIKFTGDLDYDEYETSSVYLDIDVLSPSGEQLIEDGQLVTITITGHAVDGSIFSYTFSTYVSGLFFSTDMIDLTSIGFFNGPLEVTAQSEDIAGNIFTTPTHFAEINM